MSELASIGAALGGADFVQGPGGNASIKSGDLLDVKASGSRLRDVSDPSARSRVSVALTRAALSGDAAAERALLAARPRPSLEVYFHALGPRAVVHTHPLGALLVACAAGRDAPSVPGAPLRVVAYARPGAALAARVRDALGDHPGDAVVLLRSHGLIVYARDASRAVSLTRAFDALCRARFGDPAPLDARVARYRSAAAREVPGGLALAVPSGPSTPERALFPDAAVFCPVLLVPSLQPLAEVAAAALAAAPRAAVLTDGARRVVVAPSARALDFAVEVLAAHDALEEALGGDASPLPPDEARATANLPAERHRLLRAAEG